MNDAPLTIIGKQHRPLSNDEARLFQAWKTVMVKHHWAEALLCTTCFANHEAKPHCKCATTDKSVTVNCPCTIREWLGVSK
jgi:hypothetical protein